MELTFIELLIIAFAGYRFTRVLTIDSLFEGTQERLDRAFDASGQVVPVTDSDGNVSWPLTLLKDRVATLFSCMYCLGFWVVVGMLWVWTDIAPWQWDGRDWITALALASPSVLFFRWETAIEH